MRASTHAFVLGFVLMATTFSHARASVSGVVPYRDGTPVAKSCAEDLLAMFPNVRPIQASVVTSTKYSGDNIAREIGYTLRTLSEEPGHVQTTVFYQTQTKFSEVPRVTVTMVVLPEIGDLPGDGLLRFLPARLGHVVVGVGRGTAARLAIDENLCQRLAESIEHRARNEAKGGAPSHVLGQKSFLSGFDRHFNAWFAFEGKVDATFAAYGSDAKVTITLKQGSAARPSVTRSGEEITVDISKATLAAWNSDFSERESDVAQIRGYIGWNLYASAGRKDVQGSWTIPFQLDRSPRKIPRLAANMRVDGLVAAPMIEGHPYRRFQAMMSLFVDIWKAGIRQHCIRVPTSRGDITIYISEAAEIRALATALEEAPGDPTLSSQNALWATPDMFVDGDADLLVRRWTPSLRPGSQLSQMAELLALDDHETRQLCANVFHQFLIRGWLLVEDGFETVVPPWMVKLKGRLTAGIHPWSVLEPDLAAPSEYPSNWSWIVWLLHPSDRKSYVAWLHKVPVAHADRLLDKHRKVLESLTPEQVDAKLLEAKP